LRKKRTPWEATERESSHGDGKGMTGVGVKGEGSSIWKLDLIPLERRDHTGEKKKKRSQIEMVYWLSPREGRNP